MVCTMYITLIAGGKPCSGKKGVISHCEGSQFVCNDGSVSKLRKIVSDSKNDRTLREYKDEHRRWLYPYCTFSN